MRLLIKKILLAALALNEVRALATAPSLIHITSAKMASLSPAIAPMLHHASLHALLIAYAILLLALCAVVALFVWMIWRTLLDAYRIVTSLVAKVRHAHVWLLRASRSGLC